jgi:MFS superfamily sulfate permease-like transporter
LPPIQLFASFLRYRPAWLGSDLIAGIMLAAIAIPEQMATAHLAGMPPQAGLYAFAAGGIAFAIFGANRFVSVGADSTVAPIFAGSITALATASAAQYPLFVGWVALLSGSILVIAGLLRAGWIADFLSVPVTIGFLAGISVHIIVAQLPQVLGVPEASGPLLLRLAAILAEIPKANPAAVVIGLAVFALAFGAERISARIPGALIGLALAAIAAAALGLPAQGLAMLGALPSAPPVLAFPAIDLPDALRLLPIAVIVSLVCIMQTATVVRLFPSDETVFEDPSPDFAAVGAGSILSALIGGFAVNASPPRTAVVRESGGRSQLASVTALACIGLLVLFFSNLTALVPQAALGGVLVFIGARIFRVGDMLRIAQYGGIEIWFVGIAALLVIVLPIEVGMALSIGLSLARGIYVIARPPSTELVHVSDSTIWWPPSLTDHGNRVPGIVVFAPAAPIAFTNGQFIVARLRGLIAAAAQPVRLVVIEGSGVLDVDYTGARILCDTIGTLRKGGIEVALARLSDPDAQVAAKRTGLIDSVGEDHVFRSVDEAIVALGGYEPLAVK